jgi:hypothetical protein
MYIIFYISYILHKCLLLQLVGCFVCSKSIGNNKESVSKLKIYVWVCACVCQCVCVCIVCVCARVCVRGLIMLNNNYNNCVSAIRAKISDDQNNGRERKCVRFTSVLCLIGQLRSVCVGFCWRHSVPCTLPSRQEAGHCITASHPVN